MRFDTLFQDLCYAIRLVRKAPGFSAILILTLALGIGANTAVFSVLHAVLLRPLPYEDSNRLVVIWERQIQAKGVTKLFDLYSDYETWKANARSFEGFAAVSWSPQASPQRILTGQGPARTVYALPVTADFFPLLKTPAMSGRTFDAGDMGHGCLVVLAHGQSIESQTVRLDDRECTVAGVMPPGFAFLPPEQNVAMWTLMPPPSRPDQFGVAVFGRLKPNVSLGAAQQEILALHRAMHAHDRWGALVEPVVYDLHDEFTWLTGRNLRVSLIVLFTAVSFVLLICCVNVANLLLARATGRYREMAIRAALGSGRSRLLRQLFTEHLVLAAIASSVGFGLAAGAIQYFRTTHAVELPPGAAVEINSRVLWFTAALAIVTALLFGVIPAWKASRVDLNEALKSGGRAASRGIHQQRFGRALIVAEVTLTVVLLASAGLLIQSMIRFASTPLGFRQAGLLTASVRLPRTTYREPTRRLDAYDRLSTELAQIPEVEGIAFSSTPPINGGGSVYAVEIEGQPEPRPESLVDTNQQTISPDYFRIMGTPLIRGRFFERFDSATSEPVAIINEALVRNYFPHQNPIGQHIRPFATGNRAAPWWRVVGVAGNEKRTNVFREMDWVETPIIYRPLSQESPDAVTLLARVAGSGRHAGASIQERARAAAPDVPLEALQTVSELEAAALAYPRFRAALLGTLAGLAVLLAMVGLFGVLSHSVAQRTQEMGIRAALGAPRSAIFAMVLKDGLLVTGIGACLGLAMAWVLGRYFAALLYETQPADPVIFAAVLLAVIPAALLAMYLPARRASRIDPMRALNYE